MTGNIIPFPIKRKAMAITYGPRIRYGKRDAASGARVAALVEMIERAIERDPERWQSLTASKPR